MIFFLLVISLAVGLLLEDIGAEIEKFYRDQFDPTGTTWNNYLKKPAYSELKDLEPPPTGIYITETAKDYINSIVLRLKFELGMAVALPFTIVGLLVGSSNFNCQLITPQVIIATIVLFILDIYLLIEALNSVELLNKTRRNINLINSVKITNGTITNATLTNGIYNNQIITAGIINNATLTAGTINNATLTAGTITNGEITGATITNATINNATNVIITDARITDAIITGAIITGATIELNQINENKPYLAITFIVLFALAIGAIVGAIVGANGGAIVGWAIVGAIVGWAIGGGAIVGAIGGCLIVLLLRDNRREDIISTFYDIKPKFNSYLSLFIKIVGFSLVMIVLYIVFYLQVPRLCIATPTENTKFLMRSPVSFEGKAYGDIKTLKISADGHKMSDKLLVTENKWNFPYSFKNVGDRQITIEGMNAEKEVIAKQKVTITILDP